MDRFYSPQTRCHFYPMITKNTTTLMDSKDCLYIGGNATGRLFSTSGRETDKPRSLRAYTKTNI